MNILFLHPNFPAQFKHIATHLARDNNNDVKFICETHYGRRIKGVELIISTKKDGKESKTNGPVNENIEISTVPNGTGNALQRLRTPKMDA